MSQNPAMTPQQKSLTEGGLKTYKNIAVGENASWISLFGFEIYQILFTSLPGILGLALRSLFAPFVFGKVGKRPALGRNLSIRNPSSIFLGSKIVVDDGVAIEVRGAKGKIQIGDRVIIGKNSIITSKNAELILHAGVNISTNCRIATQSRIEIGESTLIAAYAYIGPGNHQQGDEKSPLIEQPMEIKGGVHIGKHCWIGAHSTILDGVTIGDGAIVGAHSLVKDNVPAGAIVAGIPARIIQNSKVESISV